ncbi:T-lymphocyte triggering factor [Strigomonas culicis]|uniref:T-lymphocyte triggering factor n=1 Tax=Strigomonas culicis TaxID=28005 RepID=S9UBU9_9TRYP|nr:T-lymphocyte triggering factor [Strigomonas culicis]EPY36212.1 T-lymphocyte triggering factor [Strigomonas culicis]|eukprot:EPY26204.1 T-lymphocyte triggering factor [Strigomonas culicis]
MSAPAQRAPGAKGKKSKAAANPIDDIKAIDADIHDVLEKAQELRNYFQVERDKVNTMWGIAKQELEDARNRLFNTESEMEELERSHQVELKVYKQKVRHILYDHKVGVKSLKDASDMKLQDAETQHHRRMADIEEERGARGRDTGKSLETHEGNVADQRDTHQYMVTVTKRQNHEKELARLKASYEAKLTSLREDLELRRRAEVNDAEELSNEHINALMRQHEEKFAEMKAYYNNITKNNLEIIKSLKEEITAMKQSDEQNENLIYDIEKENNSLAEPLEQAEKVVAALQLKKKAYLQDKQRLQLTRARLRKLREEMKVLRDEHEQLEEQFKSVYDERESLKTTFEHSLREAMDVVSERNTELQQNLIEANARVEERDVQLDGVLRAMHLEPSTLDVVAGHIDEELHVKNQIIKDLYFELKKAEKKVEAVMTEYERRCKTVHIPPLMRDNFNQTL